MKSAAQKRNQQPPRGRKKTPQKIGALKIKLYAFSTSPALIAFTLTQARFTAPLAVRTLMRWTFGLKVRLDCLTSCKPMPPLFLL